MYCIKKQLNILDAKFYNCCLVKKCPFWRDKKQKPSFRKRKKRKRYYL